MITMRAQEQALSDPYYAEITSTQGLEAAVDAGFFEIEGSYEEVSLLTHDITPVRKIPSSGTAQDDTNLAVLVMTGAFAPLHEGHVQAMTAARKVVEQKHRQKVIGGYFVPDHDSYVGTKHEMALTGVVRVVLCERACADIDWLMCDPWAVKTAPYAVNFTQVIEHVQRVVGPSVRVYFVYGSDNLGFSEVFLHKGYGICVGRGDASPLPHVADPQQDKVLMTYSGNSLSSTVIRSGMYQLDDSKGRYSLRNTIDRQERRDQLFVERLSASLSLATHCSVVTEQISTQMLSDLSPHQTISLDMHHRGTVNLDICRVFAYGDDQSRPLSLGHRPGALPLETQISAFPPGDYIVVDDDISTGFTMRSILDLLPSHINVLGTHAFVQSSPEQVIYDIADAHDFLIGHPHCGLVVKLDDGSITRVPYMYPYVNLVTRASIAREEIITFSVSMWNANYHYYKNDTTTVQDLQPYIRDFWIKKGFTPLTQLSEICQWHIDHIADITDK